MSSPLIATPPALVNVEDLAARMMLSAFNTGAWRATRQHKAETHAENARHNTNAAKVSVRVTNNETLSDILKLHAAARVDHNRITLPSEQANLRMLPANRQFEHADMMAAYKDKHDRLVRDFMAVYDDEKASAPARLNGLHDDSMWPPHSEVERRFRFETRYLPTPTTGGWGDFLMASAAAAEAELRDRLREALTRVRDRCKSDGKLYASVFDSVRDLAALVPDLDFSGHYAPVVAAMAPLAAVNADSIRDDETARNETAKTAASILSILGGIK